MSEIPVLIVGAGPVGLTLALELARHGVGSTVFERNADTTRYPKMDLTNGRSMELYRRLGLSGALREQSVPRDSPFDIYWSTSPTGSTLHRFPYPSARQRHEQIAQTNDGTGTAESGVRISQIILEPILRSAAAADPLIDLHFDTRFERLSHEDNGATAYVSGPGGEQRTIRANWLIGCDGGGSAVRRNLKIGLDGAANLARVLMIHFRSNDRATLNREGVAWHLQTDKGSLIAQDDKDTWTVHMVLPPGCDEALVDAAAYLRDFVGRDFSFEILLANIWSPNLLVADGYCEGRVVLAGDAAHQYVPTGGYGMNTGVGDAVDLGWKLAAIINGWGGPALFASYEAERRPVALQNRAGSERHFGVRVQIAELFAAAKARGDLDAVGADGDALRRGLGEAIARLGNAENESWGIEHGYRYERSPVIVYRPNQNFPPFDPLQAPPIVQPGYRLPHVGLKDGAPLIDRLGRGLTLLAIDGVAGGSFAKQAAAAAIPLDVVPVDDQNAVRLLGRRLILVRPDQHIAWMGDGPPDDARGVLMVSVGQAIETP